MKYNPYPQIDLPYGKDNRWFYYLFESILRVDSRYTKYQIKVEDGSLETSLITKAHLERVFAYELYRQWMNYLGCQGVSNIVLNGELGKWIKSELFERNDNEKQNHKDVYPDLVLHKSQGDDEQQLIVCEIKRLEHLKSEGLFEDLHKICCYLNANKFWKKPFNYGVFIIEGEKAKLDSLCILESNTKSVLFNTPLTYECFIKDKKYTNFFSKIVCISYDGFILEYDTLDNLINNMLKKR